MLVFSQQIKIVSDTVLSFKRAQKIFTKPGDIRKYLGYLKGNKYIYKIESDFRFLVLWTVFERRTSIIDTLRILQSYDDQDIKDINKEKEKIITYMNTLDKDLEYTRSKILTPGTVLDMYKRDLISCLFVYQYFLSDQDLTRIQSKTVNNIKFFISYFPVIEQYLKNK